PADNIVARAATCIHLANIHGILCSIINPRVFVTPHQMAVAVKAIRTFTVAPDVLVTVMVARPPAVVCAFRSDPPRFSPKWYVFPVVGSFNPSNARVTSGGLIVPTQRTEAERPDGPATGSSTVSVPPGARSSSTVGAKRTLLSSYCSWNSSSSLSSAGVGGAFGLSTAQPCGKWAITAGSSVTES